LVTVFSGHDTPQGSTLTLLVARVLLVDHVQLALPAYDLAIVAALLDGCPYFHVLRFILLVPEDDPAPRKVIRAHLHSHFVTRKDPDVIHPHFPGNGGQDLVSILQLDLEHGVAESFQNDPVLFDERLFGHTFWVRKDSDSSRIGKIFLTDSKAFSRFRRDFRFPAGQRTANSAIIRPEIKRTTQCVHSPHGSNPHTKY
jgi:hypothetical protein